MSSHKEYDYDRMYIENSNICIYLKTVILEPRSMRSQIVVLHAHALNLKKTLLCLFRIVHVKLVKICKLNI